MNRFQFEETLFNALYEPMRAAWDRLEASDAAEAADEAAAEAEHMERDHALILRDRMIRFD